MLFEDTYKTIQDKSEGAFRDRGSKFLAFAIPVTDEGEVRQIVNSFKKEHPGANHHCYAFRLGADKLFWKANDDGEPSGTAGKPIYGKIQSHDLTNILIIVVRYFGGTLLGVSGLINAYRTAAAEALNNATVITKTVNEKFVITFSYEQMNDVMKIIKEHHLSPTVQDFNEVCRIEVEVRKHSAPEVENKLKKINGVLVKIS